MRISKPAPQAVVRLISFLVIGAAIVAPTGATAGDAHRGPTPPLTLDERIAAHRAVEEVLWQHRLWPAENTAPKPGLDAVLPAAALRERAEQGLLQSAALEALWNRPVTSAQLQAEIDRMTRETQQGALLQEIFAALHNDPRLVAETVARPALAERLLRDGYATDDRFHGLLRQRAESELALYPTRAEFEAAGIPAVETTWRLRDPESTTVDLPGSRANEVALDAPDWNRRVLRLRGGPARPAGQSVALRAPGPLVENVAAVPEDAGDLRVGSRTGLQEDSDSFYVEFVVDSSRGSATSARVTWPKEPFDTWWADERARLTPARERADASYTLPPVVAAACTYDTWTQTLGDTIPDARGNQSAVWTGTEMIVWGGSGDSSGARFNPVTATWTPTSEGANVPSSRYFHMAVWSGTEMLVWGGQGGTYLNSGGRYNPVTNTWAPMTTVGAPAPRSNFGEVSVWTGTEMIVWGGDNGGFLADGGRYKPSTDTWTAMSASPLAGRRYQAAVWTGTEMIIWGGETSSGMTNTGARYNPVSDTWNPTSLVAAPTGRDLFAVVWTGSEMVIWAGLDAGFTLVNTGGKYNPVTDTWTATATTAAPLARYLPSGVWTGTKAIFWGGYNSTHLNTGGQYTPTPGAGSWTATGTGPGTPLARQQHSAVFTGTEMIVWGGFGSANSPTNTGSRYNPSTNTWAIMPVGAGVPAARYESTLVWDGVEAIVWGGANGAALNTGSRYTPATNTWSATSTTSAPLARKAHAAQWSGTQMVVWGGTPTEVSVFNTGGRYNPVANTWVATSTVGAPLGRYRPSSVWTGTRMVVFGGVDAVFSPVGVGGRYDPTSDTWLSMSAVGAPSARWSQSAVWNGSRMIVWGGTPDFGTTLFNTGGQYDPAGDSWLATAVDGNTPSPRMDAAAVAAGGKMIVQGGWTSGGSTATGSTYDPVLNAWGPVLSMTGAHVAQGPGSIVTATEMMVWSGWDGSDYPNTGARFDIATNAWTPMTTANAPRGMFTPSSVWTGDQMMVWGFGKNVGGLYCTAAAPAVVAAGRVPDNNLAPGTPLTIAMAGGGQITLAWGTSCQGSDADYEVYEGAIGGLFTSHVPVLCSTGGLTMATMLPSGGDRYYLVVPRSSNREGSYGVNSSAVQRASSGSACFAQLLAGCAP